MLLHLINYVGKSLSMQWTGFLAPLMVGKKKTFAGASWYQGVWNRKGRRKMNGRKSEPADRVWLRRHGTNRWLQEVRQYKRKCRKKRIKGITFRNWVFPGFVASASREIVYFML